MSALAPESGQTIGCEELGILTLQPNQYPVLRITYPDKLAEIPCSFARGILQERCEYSALLGLAERPAWAVFANFPVNFPDIREFKTETG